MNLSSLVTVHVLVSITAPSPAAARRRTGGAVVSELALVHT